MKSWYRCVYKDKKEKEENSLEFRFLFVFLQTKSVNSVLHILLEYGKSDFTYFADRCKLSFTHDRK